MTVVLSIEFKRGVGGPCGQHVIYVTAYIGVTPTSVCSWWCREPSSRTWRRFLRGWRSGACEAAANTKKETPYAGCFVKCLLCTFNTRFFSVHIQNNIANMWNSRLLHFHSGNCVGQISREKQIAQCTAGTLYAVFFFFFRCSINTVDLRVLWPSANCALCFVLAAEPQDTYMTDQEF